jgi:hypothetical protein
MPEMLLAEDNDMIKAVPSDRADEPFWAALFAMAIVPRSVGLVCPLL